MTFLETLWQLLYAEMAMTKMADYTAGGRSVSQMTAAQLQEIADEAAAFADSMCTRTPAATVAALETAIAALKTP
jgi:hypothetical protein